MSEMRGWLDTNGFELSTFSCCDAQGSVLVSVQFRAAGQATAFAERFAGQPKWPASPDPEGQSAGQIVETGLSQYAVGR
jgi:hypothetical protein